VATFVNLNLRKKDVKKMLEKKIEAALVAGIKRLGGISYKFNSPSRRSVPDRLIIINGRVLFVELKSTKAKLTEKQSAEINKLKSAGAEVYVLYGITGVESFLARLS